MSRSKANASWRAGDEAVHHVLLAPREAGSA
jgi:hypothetical protein